MNARNQFFAVKRLGQIIIRTKAKAFQFAVGIIRPRQDQDWRFDPRQAQLAQHFVTRHIRQVQIQKDQIVIVQFGQIYAVFAQIGAVYVQIRMSQHHFDAARCCRIVFHQKNAHL